RKRQKREDQAAGDECPGKPIHRESLPITSSQWSKFLSTGPVIVVGSDARRAPDFGQSLNASSEGSGSSGLPIAVISKNEGSARACDSANACCVLRTYHL